MFPEHVTLVLQDLSYVALIFIAPCTLYNTLKNLQLGHVIDKHIAINILKFSETDKHLGRHDSEISGLQSQGEEAMEQRLRTLIKQT